MSTPNPQQQSSDPWDAVGTTPAASAATTTSTTTASPNPSSDPWDAVPTSTSAAPSKSGPGLTPAEMGTIAANVATAGTPVGANPLTAGVAKGAAETLHTLGAAAGHLMPNSWRDAIGLPSSFKEPDYLQSSNGAETAGKVAEGIAEFVMGDEALKGLQITERLGLAQKMASMAKSSPYIAKILEHGLTAIRQGAVTVPQQLAHGATPTEAAKTGAVATGLGFGTGVITEAASPVVRKAASGIKNFVTDAVQGERVAQPVAQSAVRAGLQSSVDATNAAAAKEVEAAAQAKATPVDKYPVSIEHDADGNIINADGRHRVVEAWERGDKTIPVTTKLADGATEVIEQAPQAVAKKMGLGSTVDEARQSLDATDAQQQAVRAGNGKARPPVFETPTPKTSSAMTPVESVKAPDVNEPLTKNSKTTIVDDHLDALQQQEKAAYQKMDDAAGFDVKALKNKLATDQYNLKQLGSSDPDKTGRLVEAINDSTDRIAEAEAKMNAAGVDPDAADALHKRGMAGQDFRKSLLKATTPDGSLNIKKLWDDAKTMRNSRYGDRLEQWFGSRDAADAYVKALEKAQASGVQAMKNQAFAKQILWKVAQGVAYGAGTAGLGLGLYEVTH